MNCHVPLSGEVALLVVVVVVVAALFLPWWGVVVVLVAIAAPALLVSRQVRRALRRPAAVGAESLPGAGACVVARLPGRGAPTYLVRLDGELWRATAAEELAVGDRAMVLDVRNNHLVVCRMPPELAELEG